MPDAKETILHGIAASPGIAIGEALVVSSFYSSLFEPECKHVSADRVEDEVEKFHRGLDVARMDLKAMQRRIQRELDAKEASIFDAHLLVVDDRMLHSEVEQLIRAQSCGAAYAFYVTITRYIKALSAMSDDYIRERADDIKDVASRILSNLHNSRRPALDHLEGRRVLVASDLTPSATALLDRENVLAFAVGSGSQTSHTAILARSMKIPAVVGLKDVSIAVNSGESIIVDGYVGMVIIHPSDSTIELYRQKELQEDRLYRELVHESRLRPETVDGYCVQLAANVDNPGDIKIARRFGAAGIGLFRTEYLFINREDPPSEEEQFEVYRELLSGMGGQSATIRTIDVGGDKLQATLNSLNEPNPFLGLRGVRLCLRERPEVLRTQLRAMMRASVFGKLKIMFPMISSTLEVVELKEILAGVREELKQERIAFSDKVEVGIMIETPAAALLADSLAGMVDFFSIGTNDLIQYTIAVDRGNEKVAYLYNPTHPAVLELIHRTAEAANRNNIWVSVCGEMAGSPLYTPLLAGLGIHELSMSPYSLGQVRRVIRKMRMHEAEEVAMAAMRCTTSAAALELSVNYLRSIVPDVLDISSKGL